MLCDDMFEAVETLTAKIQKEYPERILREYTVKPGESKIEVVWGPTLEVINLFTVREMEQ